MTTPMRWWGPKLDDDQRDLQIMLDDFCAAHDQPLSDDPGAVSVLIGELAELGVWTLGTDEAAGGGGADPLMTLVVHERLGRKWPALAWASVQAHAAVDLLAGDPRCEDILAALHAGQAAVAVVDLNATQVHLSITDGTWTGAVDRIDAAASEPYLLLLTGPDTAVLVQPSALTSNPLRRTGFVGALTRSLEVDADSSAHVELRGVDTARATVRLRLGAAAIAAGLAGAASDGAAAYAADRVQFGAALTAIQTVRQSLLAQAAATVVVLSAAASTTESAIGAYAVMQQACEEAIDVTAAALQSHGGYGYLTEYDAERLLRDAVSLRAAVDTTGTGSVSAAQLVGAAGPASR